MYRLGDIKRHASSRESKVKLYGYVAYHGMGILWV